MSSGKQERISLYYQDGRSDKVYQTQLEASGDGFVVNYQFGRRGSTLQSGTKTELPVSYEKAKKIYDKLVAEKRAKDYQPGESGTAYRTPNESGRKSGLLPQLLNAIDADAAARLIEDDKWLMQEKKDGCRLLLRCAHGIVEGVNRKGGFVAVPQPVAEALRQLGGSFVLDGESVGDVFWAFDLLELNGEDLRTTSFRYRYAELFVLLDCLPADSPVRVVACASNSIEKASALKNLQRNRAEGVVLKLAEGKYVPGRPNSGGTQLKYKFIASATCKVLGQNGDKRSVRIAVLSDTKGTDVEVGKVTIPPNHKMPARGALVEVQYLYAFPGGSLYQPVYRGTRDDVHSPDLVESLKWKQGGDDEANDL